MGLWAAKEGYEELLDVFLGEGLDPAVDGRQVGEAADEAAAVDWSGVGGEDLRDGAGAPGLLVDEGTGCSVAPTGGSLEVEGLVVEEAEGDEGPEVAPSGGEGAGSGRFFEGKEGQDLGEDAVGKEADEIRAGGHVGF